MIRLARSRCGSRRRPSWQNTKCITIRSSTKWPEDLVAEIERCGIATINTFQNGGDLFLYSEIHDPDAWKRLWNSPVHRRWAELMEPLMNLLPDGTVDAGESTQIFQLDTPLKDGPP